MSNYIWKLEDLKSIKKNGYKVFSCFSCGGGSCMGYKLAGFEIIGNCEIDKTMNDVYSKNISVKYSYNMPIQEMLKLKEYPKELYNLDILDGSPPCSTFSVAGEREKNWGKKKKFKEGQAEQILDDLFFDYIELANKLKPKVIVAENVKGLITGNAKGYVNLIIKKLNEIGYKTQIFLLNSATMGVPQSRERVFFIATRKDLNLPPIHLQFNYKPILYGEFKDAKHWKHLNHNTQRYKMWFKKKPSDKNLADINIRERGKRVDFNVYFVKDNEVAHTVTASNPFIRFDVPGLASDKDIITIQTFPQDYDFNGQEVQYVCGMSVPPIMMQRIAEQVKKQLLDRLEK